MTNSAIPKVPAHFVQRGVRIRLMGGKTLDGTIHIPEGMPLLQFLATKRFFLNLTSVVDPERTGSQDPIGHLSLRLSNVVWVIPTDGSLHISNAPGLIDSHRPVELQLVDGLTLSVSLNIAEEQRMSDYLDGNTGFVPLFTAVDPTTGETIERLAVNHEAIMAIREIRGGP